MNKREDTRAAWDKTAQGYHMNNTPTQMWLGERRPSPCRASFRHAVSAREGREPVTWVHGCPSHHALDQGRTIV